jgi:PST family polysaccharide transporter
VDEQGDETLSDEGRSSDFFATSHLADDLRGRALRGGAVTLTGQGAMLCLQVGSTMVLARLLTPSVFGLIAMMTAVTGFLALFKDLGLSTATVQKRQVTHEEVNFLFWVNVTVSAVLMIVVAALGPALALLYREPALTLITAVTSIGFLFDGLGVQHAALLQRQMRFVALTVIQVSAMAISVAVAIVMALCGTGYWALVAMSIVTAAVATVGYWVACSWRPGRPRRAAGVREMLAFGGYLTGFNTVNYFARNMDNVLIGWRWGPGPLGLYSRAYSILMLPLQQINAPAATVAVPSLSRLQDEPDRYRRAYREVLGKLTLVTAPLVALMTATSGWIIAIVLGPQWHGAAAIFAWLGIAAFVQPVTNTTGWLFITQHRTREFFIWGLIGSAIAVASFVVGLPHGPVGVAAAYAISSLLIGTPCLLWYVGRRGPVSAKDILQACLKPWLTGLAVLAVIVLLRLAFPHLGPVVGLALAAALTAAIMLPVLRFTRLGKEAVADLRSLLRHRAEARA